MEREVKLIFSDDAIAEYVFEIISRGIEINNLRGGRPKEQNFYDIYFDTDNLLFEQNGFVSRLRKEQEERRLEVKWLERYSGNLAVYNTKKSKIMQESEAINIIKDTIQENNPLNILKDQIHKESIKPIAEIVIYRKIIPFTNIAGDIKIWLNLDRVIYRIPGNDKETDLHFEIEIKSEPESGDIDVFRERLRNLFGLIPFRRSKLSRFSFVIRKRNKLRNKERVKVILDMDPGVDDALAIMLAMNSPELEVLAITSVGGNVDEFRCAKNAAFVIDYLNKNKNNPIKDLPVIACGTSSKKKLPDASNVHGPDGLGGLVNDWSPPDYLNIEKDALKLIKNYIEKYPGDITIISTGPATNIANLIKKHPESLKKVNEIVMMGGVFFDAGNRSQSAEFNIHADAKSAKEMLHFCRSNPGSSDNFNYIPLTFVGLDVTHKARLLRSNVENLVKAGNKKAKFVEGISKFYMDFYNSNEGLNGCYLHDPLAVGYVIDPSFCETELYHVEIEAGGEYTYGSSIADYRPSRLFKDISKEVTGVCVKVKHNKFEKFFLERVLK
jgi:purine nucleosidase